MSTSNFEASKRLDDMAKEAGITIARYQNPLDMSKTNVKTNPADTIKLSHQRNGVVEEVDMIGENTGDDMIGFGAIEKKSSFKDLIRNSQKSLEHALPTSSSPINTTTTTKGTSTKPPTTTTTTTTTPNNNVTKISATTKPLAHHPPQQPLKQQQQKSLKSTTAITLDKIDSDYTQEERQEKAAEFYEIIETKLVPELTRFQKKRETSARTLHDLEQLMDSIRGLQMAQNHGQKTMECKVNLGCKVHAEAKFVNTGKIVIDIGLGIFAEVSYNDALDILSTRCNILHKQLSESEKQCCFFSSRIKGAHEAIGALSDITEGLEQRAPLRDVWAQ